MHVQNVSEKLNFYKLSPTKKNYRNLNSKTNVENWILIDQDLPTFVVLFDKEMTDLQTKTQEENNEDYEEANEEITKKETRIELIKLIASR